MCHISVFHAHECVSERNSDPQLFADCWLIRVCQVLSWADGLKCANPRAEPLSVLFNHCCFTQTTRFSTPNELTLMHLFFYVYSGGITGLAAASQAASPQPDVVSLLIGIYGGAGPFLDEYRWAACSPGLAPSLSLVQASTDAW